MEEKSTATLLPPCPLKGLILEMSAEIAALPSGVSKEYPDGVSPKRQR